MTAAFMGTSMQADTIQAMTPVATREFSCRPWAPLDVDGHADAIDLILASLEANPRALAPTVGFDSEPAGRVDAVFQVADESLTTASASLLAIAIFDDALHAAALEQRTAGLAIVEGGDPDLLP